MFDFKQIKAVIWDLDETFWNGVLSENSMVTINKNIELVGLLSDTGIINSICSKNYKQDVDVELEKLGIQNLFVFNSINWEPKGQRVQKQIADLNLRDENVLFIDDNHLNIQEVRYYNPNIMYATPDDIHILYDFAVNAEKQDKSHKRLNQYKLLEKKISEKKSHASNEEFLYCSNIKVIFNQECSKEIDRIHDMILRTNQLNFTKNRMSKQELVDLCQDSEIRSGFVSVSDKFGDYGIVGFYALKNKKAIHFLFSCRTIGMGIEQYVFAKLGYPDLEVVGDVTGELTRMPAPGWINHENETEMTSRISSIPNLNPKILFKGPCDLNSLIGYLDKSDNIESEFTYVNEKTGVGIEQINHTCHMVQALTLTEEQKLRVINELPFSDPNMYSDLIFKKPYDIIFLSILVDANLGVYKRKNTGEMVAFTEAYYPITEEQNWDLYESGKLYTSNCKLSKKFLKEFSAKYEFCGRLSIDQIIENLKFIRKNINAETLMVIMLGSETYYERNNNPAYNDRHLIHKQINLAVKSFSRAQNNTICFDINKYIENQSSFYFHFNHYTASVYYSMAKDIAKIINENTKSQLASTSSSAFLKGILMDKLKKALSVLKYVTQ